jgi:transcriptional regulator GlxA family with amidase domain
MLLAYRETPSFYAVGQAIGVTHQTVERCVRRAGAGHAVQDPFGPCALADVETIDFIRQQGQVAEYVTSVCMGAFLLGAAGLLKGRRATTHWAYVGLLPLVGARHERGRIVQDGNVFTSAGVSAGIDFAFCILVKIAGPEVARALQLGLEYDPSLPSMPATPTKRPQRRWRSWSNATLWRTRE